MYMKLEHVPVDVAPAADIAAAIPAGSSEMSHVPAIHGWFDALKERFSAYPAWAIEMTVFAIIGLFLGLLFKMFGRYFVAIVCAVVILFVVLSHFQVLHVDVEHLKELFGLSAVQSLSELVTLGVEWAKAHLIGCASAAIGYILLYGSCHMASPNMLATLCMRTKS
jgi:hypothetical protein